MSCLFDSLAAFVPDTAPVIRQRVCDYIDSNKPLLEGIETKSMFSKAYTTSMRNSGTWGGGSGDTGSM